MSYQQENQQISVMMFIHIIMNLVTLNSNNTQTITKKYTLLIVKYVIGLAQFIQFMMLPKFQLHWTKRKDQVIHSRYQLLRQNFMILSAIQLIIMTLIEATNLQLTALQQIFVLEVMYLPGSTNYFIINLSFYVVIQLMQLYKFDYGIIHSGIQSLFTVSNFYILKIYLSSKQARFAKPQINIEQEINKIFIIPRTEIDELTSSNSSLDQIQNTYISIKISSYDGSDLKLKKLNNFKNIISLLVSMSNAELQQQEIDFFQIKFEEYLGYNQKHFTILISLVKYFCDSLFLEVNIIVSQNEQLNKELNCELSHGLYVIGFNQLQKSKSSLTDSEAIYQISDLILRMEHDIDLCQQDKYKIFKKVLDLSPPQFEIESISSFLFHDQNINLMKIQPYITINHIIEYFSYKFLVIDAEQYENKENFIEFDQVINEIETKIQQLLFNMQYELEQIFMFCKLDQVCNTDVAISNGRSTDRQLNSARLIKNRQFGSFNGSKADEMPNEIIQHQNAMLESFNIVKDLIWQIYVKWLYLLHLSSWQEKKLVYNTLFKSALVKARPTCIPYFYLSFITMIFISINYQQLKEFQYEQVQSSFLGLHLSLLQVNNICLVMLVFASFLQIITNITPAFSHYKLINNTSNLQTDAIKNLVNINDSKTLEQPKIGLGKKLVCFIYEVVALSAIYFLFFSTNSIQIILSAQHRNNTIFFYRLISNLMFMIGTTLTISFSVLSQPEELVSLTFGIKIFFILFFILTGLYYQIDDIITFFFMTIIMLVYYIPQLQNFINHGRQQEQNFNLLKMKAKQIQHRIPPFTTLVYNILASKYVSLNNVIQSNYIIRRSKVINEIEEEMVGNDNFFDRLCHYRNLLQDKQKRQNSCIVYPQIISSLFLRPQNWNQDDQLDFNDFIAEMPQIYQMPIDCPNAVYFVQSENHQHLHNAIQLIIAFSQGVMKKLKIQSCAITAGALSIYVLEAGQIHVRSQCILDAKSLVRQYKGLIVDGKLFTQYKELDERFKYELQNRINLSTNKGEIEEMKSMVLKLSEVSFSNGKAVSIEIKK